MNAIALDSEAFRRQIQQHLVFSVLSDDDVDDLVASSSLISFSLGSTIIREGDSGDECYLIQSGRVRVLREVDGRTVTLATCQAGDLIGERAILKDEPRSATVRATEDVVLLQITREAFDRILRRNPALRQAVEKVGEKRELIDFLRTSRLGRAISVPQALALVDRLQAAPFAAGTTILRGGDPAGCLYLVRAGKVKVTKGDGRDERVFAKLSAGEFFGELALDKNQTLAANVIAVTNCFCLKLPREDFERLRACAPEFEEELRRRLELYQSEADLEEQFGRRPPGMTRRTLVFQTPMLPAAAGPKQNLGDAVSPQGRKSAIKPWKADGADDENGVADKRLPRRRWRLSPYPLIRQLDETDCGAACLAMVAKYHGVTLSIGKLRDLACVGQDGASLYSLAAAAEQLGFSTRALKLDFERLRNVETPAIVHWEGYHYVVVYRVKKRRVLVADPALGKSWMKRAEFEQGWSGHVLSLTPTPALLENEPAKTSFRRFLPYLNPCRGLMTEIFIASVILELLELISPVFTQVVVDRVLVHQNVNMLNLMLVGMLLVSVFQTVISLLRDYFSVHMAQKLGLRFSSDLLRQMLRLPLRFFHTRKIGDIMQRFEDNNEIQDVLTGKSISTILDVMTAVLTVTLMFYYSPPLTMVALAAIPLYAFLTLAFTPALKRNNLLAFERSAASESHLIEMFKSIGTVKGSASEDAARWRQENHLVREAKVEYRDAMLDMAMSGLSSAIDIFARLLLFWYGAHLVIQRELTIGQLVAFQSLVGMALTPIMSLIGLWDELQEAYLSLQRLADVHDFEPEQSQGASAIRLPTLRGAIVFRDVNFRYNLDDENILSGINLRIEPGETIALVGRSGSGKTTLVNLIQRFYKPSDGRVSIDNYDLSTVDLRSLRKQLGVVPQAPEIFSGTIRDNIALARPDASTEQVVFAAKLASAHDFITAFPMAYDTVVGEAGIRLSGGQMQRIAIARALLNDPRILIFDEATSALDSESEKAVQQNMQAILGDRTAILVAHRLSTVRHADRILVLDAGRIVEEGNHQELIDRKGLYFYLVSQQAVL